jgi:hypothetical protein
MKQLNATLVATVTAALKGKGKRLEKFQASIEIIHASLAQGGWTPRGSVKAQAGLTGITSARLGLGGLYPEGQYTPHADGTNHRTERHPLCDTARDLTWTLSGGCLHGDPAALLALLSEPGVVECLRAAKLSAVLAAAWIQLLAEIQEAVVLLDESRPLPRVTAIGLSPKVTATLTECNLDLDLATIKPAKVDYYKTQTLDAKTGAPVYHARKQTWTMERVYFVAWSEGIRHGRSRFAGRGCHACGKTIPSGRFVPIEALDRQSGELVSMWLGCDCARNIFGIQDEGLRQPAARTA